MTLPITAIIVSYNSAGVLPLCIEALQKQLAPNQLLVVDNASSDESVAIARALGAEVIVNDVNAGFGTGCNLGAQVALNDLLMFVNPDVCVTTADVVELTELASSRPFGLVAPRALLVDDIGHQESCMRRVLPWPCDVAREALWPVVPREVSRRLETVINSPGRRSWLSGALLLCTRTEFLDVGGFDERLFLYYEDQELSRRYERYGLPLSLTDALTGHHMSGRSTATKGEATSARKTSRSIPRGASAMSSIELVGITYGPRAACCAWWLYRCLRRCALAVAWLGSVGPQSKRSAQKLLELRCTASAVATLIASSVPHYPLVKALARRSD